MADKIKQIGEILESTFGGIQKKNIKKEKPKSLKEIAEQILSQQSLNKTKKAYQKALQKEQYYFHIEKQRELEKNCRYLG